MSATKDFHEIVLAFLGKIGRKITRKFPEASEKHYKGQKWFQKVLQWCELIYCTSSDLSGLIWSNLCTLDLSRKLNSTLHVLYSSLGSCVMVHVECMCVRECYIERVCFLPIRDHRCFNVWVLMVVEWVDHFLKYSIGSEFQISYQWCR